MQDYTGTYTLDGEAGPISLTLEHHAVSIHGRLSGAGFDYHIEAAEAPTGISGTATSSRRLGFLAQLHEDGVQLSVKLFGYDSLGRPNYGAATVVVLARQPASDTVGINLKKE